MNTIIDYISYQHSITRIKVRDALYGFLRQLNLTDFSNLPNELTLLLNNYENISLKKFLERIVLYLIRAKKKGRIF